MKGGETPREWIPQREGLSISFSVEKEAAQQKGPRPKSERSKGQKEMPERAGKNTSLRTGRSPSDNPKRKEWQIRHRRRGENWRVWGKNDQADNNSTKKGRGSKNCNVNSIEGEGNQGKDHSIQGGTVISLNEGIVFQSVVLGPFCDGRRGEAGSWKKERWDLKKRLRFYNGNQKK